MTATHDPATIVDLDRYPLGDPAASSALASSLGARLRDEGVAVLPGFVRAEAVDRIVAESDALAPDGHHSRVTNTVYLSAPDDAFAPEHPRRRAVVSALRAVAADQRIGACATFHPIVAEPAEQGVVSGLAEDAVRL